MFLARLHRVNYIPSTPVDVYDVLYDYGGRSETEILRKRDELYLKMPADLERIDAFAPV